MIITEDLARCGVVRGPVWPKPEIMQNQCDEYLFSYRYNYDIFSEPDQTLSDVVDVYIWRGELKNDIDSLVFADKYSTINNTHGSTPLVGFLDSINQKKCPNHYRTMMFIMLSLGHFTFVLKDVRDE